MGDGKYNLISRGARATTMGYMDKAPDEIFLQNKKKEIHESMEPSKALLRESRDSESNPNSLPIIIALDVTGSMRTIPHSLVKEGLPNMVANMVQIAFTKSNNPTSVFVSSVRHKDFKKDGENYWDFLDLDD